MLPVGKCCDLLVLLQPLSTGGRLVGALVVIVLEPLEVKIDSWIRA